MRKFPIVVLVALSFCGRADAEIRAPYAHPSAEGREMTPAFLKAVGNLMDIPKNDSLDAAALRDLERLGEETLGNLTRLAAVDLGSELNQALIEQFFGTLMLNSSYSSEAAMLAAWSDPAIEWGDRVHALKKLQLIYSKTRSTLESDIGSQAKDFDRLRREGVTAAELAPYAAYYLAVGALFGQDIVQDADKARGATIADIERGGIEKVAAEAAGLPSAPPDGALLVAPSAGDATAPLAPITLAPAAPKIDPEEAALAELSSHGAARPLENSSGRMVFRFEDGFTAKLWIASRSIMISVYTAERILKSPEFGVPVDKGADPAAKMKSLVAAMKGRIAKKAAETPKTPEPRKPVRRTMLAYVEAFILFMGVVLGATVGGSLAEAGFTYIAGCMALTAGVLLASFIHSSTLTSGWRWLGWALVSILGGLGFSLLLATVLGV